MHHIEDECIEDSKYDLPMNWKTKDDMNGDTWKPLEQLNGDVPSVVVDFLRPQESMT